MDEFIQNYDANDKVSSLRLISNMNNASELITKLEIENISLKLDLESCLNHIKKCDERNSGILIPQSSNNNYYFELTQEIKNLNISLLEKERRNKDLELFEIENTKLRELIGGLRDELKLIHTNLENAKQENEDLTSSNLKLVKDNSYLKIKLEQLSSSSQTFVTVDDQYKLEEMHISIQNSLNELELCKNKNIEYIKKIKQLTDEIVDLKKKHNTDLNHLNELYKSIKELNSSRICVSNQYGQRIASEASELLIKYKQNYEKMKFLFQNLSNEKNRHIISRLNNRILKSENECLKLKDKLAEEIISNEDNEFKVNKQLEKSLKQSELNCKIISKELIYLYERAEEIHPGFQREFVPRETTKLVTNLLSSM